MNYEISDHIAFLSPRRPGFYSRPIHVSFVIARVALGHSFLRILQFLPVSIISLILHIHSQLNSSLLSEGQVGEFLQLSNAAMFFRLPMWFRRKNISTFCLEIPASALARFLFTAHSCLVCQPNALCKLYLKILHLLHFFVSEMKSFCFRLVLMLSHAQLTLAVTLQHKIHLPSNTKSITKNQDTLVSVCSIIYPEESKTTKLFKAH